MTDRYENIRKALAMGPTPGPWKAHDPSESGWVSICKTNTPYATPLCYAVPYSEPLDDPGHDRWVSRAHETPANAAHIAACDPDTIRALLAERDALAKDAARYRWLRDGAYYLIEPDRGIGPMIPCGDEMDIAVDAAIDAAMEGEK